MVRERAIGSQNGRAHCLEARTTERIQKLLHENRISYTPDCRRSVLPVLRETLLSTTHALFMS